MKKDEAKEKGKGKKEREKRKGKKGKGKKERGRAGMVEEGCGNIVKEEGWDMKEEMACEGYQ